MRKLISVIATMMTTTLVNAQNIDVAVVIDQGVKDNYSREFLDAEITQAIDLSNQTLALANLEYTRRVNMVMTAENSEVAEATGGFQGALAGYNVACEQIKSESAKYEYYDNVVFLVPESGNRAAVGIANHCADDDVDQQVVIIAVDNVVRHPRMSLSVTLAHEFGHVDGMKHNNANAHYEQTGEVTLMIADLWKGDIDSNNLLAPGDATDMQNEESDANAWPKSFSAPAPEAPPALGIVTMNAEQTTLPSESGSITLNLTLDKPLEEEVSVEFYTRSGSAKQGEDYDETIRRVAFLMGQTDASLDVNFTSDRTEDESFTVGIRYGDKVEANGEVTVTLQAPVTPEPPNPNPDPDTNPNPDTTPNPDAPSSSGGGGGSLGWLALVGLLILVYRRL